MQVSVVRKGKSERIRKGGYVKRKSVVIQALDKIDRSLDRQAKKAKMELKRIDCVEQHKFLENLERRKLLGEMERFAQRGWTVQSFGWANGFQGGWYALMVRDLRDAGVGSWK